MKPASEMHSVLQGLARVDELLSWPSERLYVVVEPVSGWSPAQQVEHILLTLEAVFGVIQALESGEDPRIRPKGSPRLMARALLLTGRIPRGRAQAPKFARPDAVPSRAGLREKHGDARATADGLAGRVASLASVGGTIPHGLLGHFTALQWLRFARIHTDHHLAIIDDIDRNRTVAEPLPDAMLRAGDQP